jgi:hypothetical protein
MHAQSPDRERILVERRGPPTVQTPMVSGQVYTGSGFSVAGTANQSQIFVAIPVTGVDSGLTFQSAGDTCNCPSKETPIPVIPPGPGYSFAPEAR